MNSKNIFTWLNEIVDPGLTTNLFKLTGNFIAHLSPAFGIVFVTFAVAVFLQYYGRGFDEICVDYSKKMLFWLVVTAIAMNPDNYVYVANVLFNAGDQMAGWFTSKKSNVSFLNSASSAIMTIVGKIATYNDKLGTLEIYSAIEAFFFSLVVMTIGYIFLAIAFGLYAVIKIALALTICVGPFFVMCLMFPAVRQWGMNWIGQIVGYSFNVVLYLLTTILFIEKMKDFSIKFIELNPILFNVYQLKIYIVSLLALFVLFLIVMWKLPSIASALTGGASMEGAIAGAVRTIAMIKSAGMFKFGGASRLGNAMKPGKPDIKPKGK